MFSSSHTTPGLSYAVALRSNTQQQQQTHLSPIGQPALPVVASKFRYDAVKILLYFCPLLHIRKQSTFCRFTLFTVNVLPFYPT
jgi:hypothetical protein